MSDERGPARKKARVDVECIKPSIEELNIPFDPSKGGKDITSKEALLQACKDGSIKVVEDVLLSVEDRKEVIHKFIESCDENGLTPLMQAARSAHLDICKLLISYGADVNASNDKGNSPLVFAVQKGYLDIANLFLNTGTSVSSMNVAIIPAAHFGHLKLVNLLISSGCSPNYTNQKGTTALMRASQEGHKLVVESLLRSGANPNASNGEGMTALMLAAQRGHSIIAKSLIEAGAEVNMQTRQGSTALLLAAKRGHEGAVRVLMAAGADIFKEDDRHKTAREAADRRGFSNLLSILTTECQIQLMRQASRSQRSLTLVKMSVLFVHGRAELVRDYKGNISCVTLMSCAMKLPPPLLQNIASMLPYPRLWETRLYYLQTMAETQPSRVVVDGISIMDEILSDASIDMRPREKFSPIKALNGDGKLVQLRDSHSFAFNFRGWGPLSMNPDLFFRLKKLADLQGTINAFGTDNMEFRQPIARYVISLLKDLLEWNKGRERF